MNICTEFEEPMSILWQVIIWTRFVLYIIKLKVTVTLTFDRFISKSIGIIYTPKTNVCAKFVEPRSILCQVIIRTRFGLYINMLTVTVTLTFDRLTSKSIAITHTPTHMSVFSSSRAVIQGSWVQVALDPLGFFVGVSLGKTLQSPT